MTPKEKLLSLFLPTMELTNTDKENHTGYSRQYFESSELYGIKINKLIENNAEISYTIFFLPNTISERPDFITLENLNDDLLFTEAHKKDLLDYEKSGYKMCRISELKMIDYIKNLLAKIEFNEKLNNDLKVNQPTKRKIKI